MCGTVCCRVTGYRSKARRYWLLAAVILLWIKPKCFKSVSLKVRLYMYVWDWEMHTSHHFDREYVSERLAPANEKSKRPYIVSDAIQLRNLQHAVSNIYTYMFFTFTSHIIWSVFMLTTTVLWHVLSTACDLSCLHAPPSSARHNIVRPSSGHRGMSSGFRSPLPRS